MLNALLFQGAKAHIDSESKDTALLIASRKGHLAVVESLSTRIDTLWDVNSEGRTPLDESMSAGQVEIARELIRKLGNVPGVKTHIKARKTLELTSEQNSEELFILLLEFLREDVDYNERSEDNNMILHVMAAANFVLRIEHLLEGTPCDVNVKGSGYWIPLHTAALSGYREAVEVLLANSAAIDAKDWEGWTPLHLACYNGRVEVKTLLSSKPAPSLSARLDRGEHEVRTGIGTVHDEIDKR